MVKDEVELRGWGCASRNWSPEILHRVRIQGVVSPEKAVRSQGRGWGISGKQNRGIALQER